jgi:hypothetical protein
MNIHWHIRSTPSSAVFFEFFDSIDSKTKKVTNSYVKALYHDGNTNSFEYLFFKPTITGFTFPDFLKYLNEKISNIPFSSVKEMCQNTTIEVPKDSDYYSSDLVLKDL